MHLIKLAVGVRDLAHLAEIQARRAAEAPPLCHRTRSFPRRAAEIVQGGSIFWVVQGMVSVRQRVTDIVAPSLPGQLEDGAGRAAILLDPALVRVAARPMKPFQGWRYLAPEAAPPDLDADLDATAGRELPEALRRALAELALL